MVNRLQEEEKRLFFSLPAGQIWVSHGMSWHFTLCVCIYLVMVNPVLVHVTKPNKPKLPQLPKSKQWGFFSLPFLSRVCGVGARQSTKVAESTGHRTEPKPEPVSSGQTFLN